MMRRVRQVRNLRSVFLSILFGERLLRMLIAQ
jgi:hypothetical protein